VKGVWHWAKEFQRRGGQVRVPALVASITLRSVTSLIPLLLVAVSVTGLIARGDADLGDRILDNLQLNDETTRKVVNEAIEKASQGAGWALAVSIAGSLYLGLGVVSAIASAFDAVWQVPTRGIVDKLMGIPWLVSAVLVFGLSGFLSATVTGYVDIPYVDIVLAVASAGLTGFLAVWISMRLLTNVQLPARAHVPGAALSGIFLAVFQIIGAKIVQQALGGRNGTYGAFAGVFALFVIFNLFGNVLVYGAVANVVLWERSNGTTQLVGRAPALPIDHFVELERGGQRPHPALGSPIGRAVKFVLRRR
jgi:membrane protein